MRIIRWCYSFLVSIYSSFFLSFINYINLKYHRVEYGKNVIIRGKLNIYGRGTIIIGDSVILNSDMKYNPIGGMSGIILQAEQSGIIQIGNNVGISNAALISQGPGIFVEDDVMIGGSCKIYDTDFHSLNYIERMQKNDPGVKMGKIVIKKGAFIGGHTIILKGVTVGQFSIVGAGSVVTKDIPDNEIWAGNPAKFIRKNRNICSD